MQLYHIPETYIILDLETTGLLPEKNQIIEIGALRIENEKPADQWHSLICPDFSLLPEETLPRQVETLTHITKEMLLPAPHFSAVAADFLCFLGDNPIAGHRVDFDIAFLNAALSSLGHSPLPNDFFDSLLLSQKLLPELIHHKLGDLAAYYSIDYQGAHRALRDCEITWQCLIAMQKTARESFPTPEAFEICWQSGRRRLTADSITANPCTFDASHPFYGKNIAITGVLHTLSRRAAMQKIADAGGKNQDKVNTFTHVLIHGSTKGTSKEQKALRLQAEGNPIQILSEQEFLKIMGLSQ